MRGEPGLDIAATFRRQLVVDIGVQFVFGDGYLLFTHGRRLSVETFSAPTSFTGKGKRGERQCIRCVPNPLIGSFIPPGWFTNLLIFISPAAAPSVAPPPGSPARGRCRVLPPRCRWRRDCCRAAA